MRLFGNLPACPPLPSPWANVGLVYADIGARGGPPAEWLKLSKQIDYVCFEPDPEEVKRLELVFRKTKKFTGYVCRHALGANRKEATLHLTHFRPSSSLLQPNDELLCRLSVAEMFRVERCVEVEVRTLDEQMQALGKNCDFLKADVQGYELEVLEGAPTTLAQAAGCELEVSFIEIYKNQPLFADIDSFMRAHGFFLADLERVWWMRRAVPPELQERGTMAYGNALYLRTGITTPTSRQEAIKNSLVCVATGLHELAYEIAMNGAVNGFFTSDEEQQFFCWVTRVHRARKFWHQASKWSSRFPGRQTLGRWLGLWSRALQGVSDTGADSQSWLRRSSW